MPKESRSRMQKWPSSTLCPTNSTVTGTTHFYPVAIRSAHVTYAQALTDQNRRPAAERLPMARLWPESARAWARLPERQERPEPALGPDPFGSPLSKHQPPGVFVALHVV